MTFVLGLTGSIGMGKSTSAAMFRRLGIPVHDADAEVHRLLGPGGRAVSEVRRLFPDCVRDHEVDRAALGARVFGDSGALRQLEAILHPMTGEAQRRFLAAARSRREPVVVLDIPLLFETGGDKKCDATVVVTAPRFLQLMRVIRRPGMTAQRLAAIEARQMPDSEKRRRADFIVQTGLGRRATLNRIKEIVTFVWPDHVRR